MKFFTRMGICMATAIVLGVVLSGFADWWLDDEQNNVVQMSRWIVREMRRSEALERRTEMITYAQQVRREIIAEVIAGRLPLRPAIAQVQKANGLVENLDVELVGSYWTPTDAEGVARQVLAWVDTEFDFAPSAELSCTLLLLDAEFLEMFGSPRLDEATLVADEESNGEQPDAIEKTDGEQPDDAAYSPPLLAG